MGTKFQGSEAEQRALDVYIKLMRASETVTSRINSHLREYGLTTSQFGVMESLYHLGPMCQTELAQKILKSSGNLTTVIDNLSKRGLVERVQNPDDRRMFDIHLTPDGERLISRIFPPHVTGVLETFAALSPQEQSALGDLLRRLGRSAAQTGANS